MIVIKLSKEDYKFRDQIAEILEDRIMELQSTEFAVEYDEDFTCVEGVEDGILGARIHTVLINELEELRNPNLKAIREMEEGMARQAEEERGFWR